MRWSSRSADHHAPVFDISSRLRLPRYRVVHHAMANSAIVEALLFGAPLRLALFLGCLRFVLGRLLSSDIPQAIDDTKELNTTSGSPVSTPTRPLRAIDWISGPSRNAGANRAPERASYPRMARFVFCASFSESCILFALVVFGDILTTSARIYNWHFSLASLVVLIVLIVPFGQCLLLTYRNKSSSAALSSSILVLTGTLFAVYLFCFLQLGNYLSQALGVSAGTEPNSITTNILERICVPGVTLIASLSGFGAVNTAWEAFEWRSMSKKEVVTDLTIQSAERALGRARADLEVRRAELSTAENAAQEGDSRSFFGRMLSADSASSKLSALRQEVAGLNAMEGQMIRDLHTLRSRKAALDLSKTFQGKIWSAVGVGFALYCATRIILSGVNLLFGYSSSPTGRGEAEDLTSQVLRHLIYLTGLSIDADQWSPVLNLALIGIIIVANMHTVLARVSRILHATSAAVSASFLMLCLAQLMAMYLVTSLVALPATTGSTTAQLLDTLPNFQTFSKLFDAVFLMAALGTLAASWLAKRIRADDPSAADFALEVFGRGDDGRSFV